MSRGQRRWHKECWQKRGESVRIGKSLKALKAMVCPGCEKPAPPIDSQTEAWHLSKGGTWWCDACWTGSIDSGRFQIGTVPQEIRTKHEPPHPPKKRALSPPRQPPHPPPWHAQQECEAPPPHPPKKRALGPPRQPPQPPPANQIRDLLRFKDPFFQRRRSHLHHVLILHRHCLRVV